MRLFHSCYFSSHRGFSVVVLFAFAKIFSEVVFCRRPGNKMIPRSLEINDLNDTSVQEQDLRAMWNILHTQQSLLD